MIKFLEKLKACPFYLVVISVFFYFFLEVDVSKNSAALEHCKQTAVNIRPFSGLGSSEATCLWLPSVPKSTDMNLSKPRVMVKDREAWHAAVRGVTKSQTRLSD